MVKQRVRREIWIGVVLLAAIGCGVREPAKEAVPTTAEPTASVADASHLPTPFTWQQIRDEWIVGFELKLRRPADGVVERWRVVDADAELVAIEGAVFDAEGTPVQEPQVGRSTWQELRDHALFPADRGMRRRETRDTPLGKLDGWLYVVDNPDGQGATQFFFADALPGPPVQMEAVTGGEVMTVLEQFERSRPAVVNAE